VIISTVIGPFLGPADRLGQAGAARHGVTEVYRKY